MSGYLSDSKTILCSRPAAVFLQFLADPVYFTELIQGLQLPDHLVDPLLLLPIMLVSYIVLVDKEHATMPFKTNENMEHQVSIFQLALPYLFFVLLFVFTAARSNGIDAISIGSGISIVFIILRQIFVISENQKLVRQYQQKREEVKISEERYRSLLEYHPDTIFSLDLKGRIENMNTAGAKSTGYDHEFMVGTHIASIVDTQHQTAILENFQK